MFMGEGKTIVCAAAILALLLGAIGCGGDSDTGSGESASAESERPFPNVEGPTREFLVVGGDNVVQFFGTEGTEAERKQAARVIDPWMDARADSRWTADCGYMSRNYRKGLVVDANGVTNGRVTTCPQALAYFVEAASVDQIDTFQGVVQSLRLEKDFAYAQYHGNDGKDWVVPLEREDGKWWIATAAPIDRNK